MRVLLSEIRDAKHTRAANIVALLGFMANAIWTVANVFVGERFVTVENAIVSVLFLLALLLLRRNRHGAAALLISTVFLLHMLFVALTFGYASGAHQFFLLGTVIPYLVFPRSARHAANSFAALSGLAYLACTALRDQLPGTIVVGSETGMAILNAALLLLILAATTAFFVTEMRKSDDALEAEHARSEDLLYNLLPTEIAGRLKDAPDQIIADSLDHIAILYADIVGFTQCSARMAPTDLVSFLNRIFSTFDHLAAKHKLEKIKTIGDAYMVAAGTPSPVGDPVQCIAEMALDMQAAVQDMSPEFTDGLQLRIGLHAGPAIAGVIGTKKLFYDVWGETVNIASRMESHGEPGRIQLTGLAHEELKTEYTFEERGTIEVKGMGEVKTWWLTGRATSA
ncbi:adenylate/guanylate cyclase domain-containing protein [Ruegeria arenilitoris]|uniref:adenylate/guanylate cyclase domain-containing protein n=1 Tax=Ruegeria arenilitoris TaxID=1173585 RepID=UPI001CFD8B2E|nr:adenylate/guanylate cyclase domain-containing protein [Ruegeria arenilitoris]